MGRPVEWFLPPQSKLICLVVPGYCFTKMCTLFISFYAVIPASEVGTFKNEGNDHVLSIRGGNFGLPSGTPHRPLVKFLFPIVFCAVAQLFARGKSSFAKATTARDALIEIEIKLMFS